MGNKKPNQCDLVLEYMRTHNGITQLDATYDLGCTRLSARISDLKEKGYGIESEPYKARNRYGNLTTVSKYYLVEEI